MWCNLLIMQSVGLKIQYNQPSEAEQYNIRVITTESVVTSGSVKDTDVPRSVVSQ